MVFLSNNIIITKQKSGGNAVSYTQAPPNCPASSFLCKNDGESNTNIDIDGDRDATDGLEVRRNSDNVFKAQTDAGGGADLLTNAGDAWNSSITDTTSLVTSRRPAHQNTYGYDAHLFKLNNTTKQYLRNGDNIAVFRMRTSSEGYVLGMVTSEIDT